MVISGPVTKPFTSCFAYEVDVGGREGDILENSAARVFVGWWWLFVLVKKEICCWGFFEVDVGGGGEVGVEVRGFVDLRHDDRQGFDWSTQKERRCYSVKILRLEARPCQ